MLSLGILDLTFMTLRTEYSYDTAPDQLNRLWMPAREAHVWSNEASNTDQHQPGTVKRGKVQFVTLFGAVCYPFGISAYQRCIRNPDTSLLYQKNMSYQRCISDVSAMYQ